MTMESTSDNLKRYKPEPREVGSKDDSTKEPFIPFGRYLTEHYRGHKITYRELELYLWMRLHANKFGIADISTGKILDDLHHFKSVDYITKTLRSLRRKRYISYQDRKGHRRSFDVRFDYWLGEGGIVWTLGNEGRYELRGENLSSNSTEMDVTPRSDTQTPKLNGQEQAENNALPAVVVRGDKNDKEIEKENRDYSSSTPLREKKTWKEIPTLGFKWKDDNEKRCYEIAIEVDDEYMDYILSRLYHKYGGIEVIEEGYKRFEEGMRAADNNLDDIGITAAFFNHFLEGALSDNRLKILGRF